MGFFDDLEEQCRRKDSLLCVGLDPRVEAKNAAEARTRMVEQNRRIVEGTQEYAVCYKPNIAFYEAWGTEGLKALEETLALIPHEIPVLLDAKRGDIGATAEAYAAGILDGLGVTGVTLAPYMGRDTAEAFLQRPDCGLFLLCRTSNPGGAALQDLKTQSPGGQEQLPLYRQTARECLSWSDRVGLVVAGNDPQALSELRGAHPDAWFLSPGIGAQGGSMEEAVAAGIREDGLGILAVVARGISQADDPAAAARQFTEDLREARKKVLAKGEAGPRNRDSAPSVSMLKSRIFDGLIQTESFRTGQFTLKSGKVSPFYIDMRRAGAAPKLLKQLARAYAGLLEGLAFDRIAGIPVAALPLATAVSLETGIPLIYPRMQKKQHGTGNVIEGEWHQGEKIVLLDDLITTGKSKLEAVEILRTAGLLVDDLIVILERGRQGRRDMEAAKINLHSYARVEELFPHCEGKGLIDRAQRAAMEAFVQEET